MELTITSKTFEKPVKLLDDALKEMMAFMDAELTNMQKQRFITTFSKISQAVGYITGVKEALELKEEISRPRGGARMP